ncbi:hypothetical protein E2C01_024635 [Portunus trituberculatus]|uniref:Uncharacterized protein n=1 Tax=Portunus trituberculatus TaxID=210409 RepID=A0A5B7EDD1_PORTR|nr:hypothetical protein [Portunus trituberculatus]
MPPPRDLQSARGCHQRDLRSHNAPLALPIHATQEGDVMEIHHHSTTTTTTIKTVIITTTTTTTTSTLTVHGKQCHGEEGQNALQMVRWTLQCCDAPPELPQQHSHHREEQHLQRHQHPHVPHRLAEELRNGENNG